MPTMAHPFSEEEYKKGIAALKNNKAAGRDDVLVEQLKHLGQNANKWLHTMLRKQDPQDMETIQDYCHTQARETPRFRRSTDQSPSHAICTNTNE